MLLARPLRRSSALAVAILLLTGCSHVPLASDVHRRLGVGRYAALPADSVRVVELRRAPGWQAQLADSVGGPYEVLAAVRTLGAGGDAAADARAAFRRRVGEVGGNVAALLAVEKEPATPYTHAEGDAVRALPPMPDAALRCDRLDAPDSAGARVVACREASRLAPSDPSPLRALAVAHLALAQRATARRQEGLAIQSARGEAAIAAYRAGRLDPAYAAPAPYLPGAVALFGGDSLRAYQALAILLGGGPGVLSPAGGALAANREVIRLAPDSVAGYTNAVAILLAQRRPEEALRVAAALARRRPERVEGWARAAVAANALGDHVRAMRLWGRVLELDPKYFRLGFVEPYGLSEYRGSEQRAGKQPAATVDDLP